MSLAEGRERLFSPIVISKYGIFGQPPEIPQHGN